MGNILVFLFLVIFSTQFDIGKAYHEEVGIPLAGYIEAQEETKIRDRRGVGGELATIKSYPYLTGLIISLEGNYQSICTAALLNNHLLVSAAHCWYDGKYQAKWYTVVLGSEMLFKGGIVIKTSKVVTHPKWNFRKLQNDISIIYLPKKIPFTDKVQPVSLPKAVDRTKTFVGDWAVFVGFGRTDEGKEVRSNIHAVDIKVQVISNTLCKAYFHYLPSTQLCTSGRGHVGICKGDSGGPLVIKKHNENVLIGISSYFHHGGCTRGKPSGYTRVTAYYDFIRSHMSNSFSINQSENEVY